MHYMFHEMNLDDFRQWLKGHLSYTNDQLFDSIYFPQPDRKPSRAALSYLPSFSAKLAAKKAEDAANYAEAAKESACVAAHTHR